MRKSGFYTKTSGQTLYFTDKSIIFDLIRRQDESMQGRDVQKQCNECKPTKGSRKTKFTLELVNYLIMKMSDVWQ